MNIQRNEIKLGEYVVITLTDPDFNYEVNHCGKLITIDPDGRNGGVELIIKRSTVRSGECNRDTFTYKPENFSKMHIRLMEFSEMSTWTKICWFFRNVVFPLRYNTTFKPATQLVTKRADDETKND